MCLAWIVRLYRKLHGNYGILLGIFLGMIFRDIIMVDKVRGLGKKLAILTYFDRYGQIVLMIS